MLPPFRQTRRVVFFDHVGAGDSDMGAYDSVRYAMLDEYVSDVQEICELLDLENITLMRQRVSGMRAIVAATDPGRLGRLVLLASLPSRMDYPDAGYIGGFSADDLDGLLSWRDANYVVWPAARTPDIRGTRTTLKMLRRLRPVSSVSIPWSPGNSPARRFSPKVAAPCQLSGCTRQRPYELPEHWRRTRAGTRSYRRPLVASEPGHGTTATLTLPR